MLAAAARRLKSASTLGCGVFPALVHVGSRTSTGQGRRCDAGSGVGGRWGSRRGADDHRRGLDGLSCCGQGQGGRRLRVHQSTGLSPAGGRPREDRRDTAHPPARRVLAARQHQFHCRDDPPGAARRRRRRPLRARRLGVLQLRPLGAPRRPGGALVGHDPPICPRRSRHRRHRRRRLGAHCLSPSGEAHVAETTLAVTIDGEKRALRLVARRSRRTNETQRELWPHWRYHAFITNRTDLNTAEADAYHRQHATVELAIRDLKQSTGLAHLPSGSFAANAAWLACATLAHNLYRWLAGLAPTRHNNKLTVGQTVRNQLLALPGRLVNRSGRTILRLPARWPWAPTFHVTLTNIRNLPQLR